MTLNYSIVTMAEWLTRWPAKPFLSESAGSNPAGDVSVYKLKNIKPL